MDLRGELTEGAFTTRFFTSFRMTMEGRDCFASRKNTGKLAMTQVEGMEG